MGKTTFVSIGLSCQTAHQLARFADENPSDVTFQKGPFDWLICPPVSAADWLDAGLPAFDPAHVEEFRNHAYWSSYDFWFWHGFFTKTENGPVLNINDSMERELSKLAYQTDQFRNLDPATTRFFVSNTQNNLPSDVFDMSETHKYHFSRSNLSSLQKSVSRFFGMESDLTAITRPDRWDDEAPPPSNAIHLLLEDSEWKGSDKDWNEVLGSLL